MDKKSYIKGQEDLIAEIKSRVAKLEETTTGGDIMFDVLDLLKKLEPLDPSEEVVLDHEGDLLARINDNLYIHYIEVNNSHTEDEEDDIEVVTMLELSCNFHGKHCTAYINPERLDNESSGSYAMLETNSTDNLHDSFVEVMEEDEWGKIRQVCIDWLVQHKHYSNCDTANNRAFN